MMDTVSNEQGAEVLGKKNNPDLEYSDETPNRNLMTHTISNEQGEQLAQGTDITRDDSQPRNKLLDIKGNEGFENPEKGGNFTGNTNSTRYEHVHYFPCMLMRLLNVLRPVEVACNVFIEFGKPPVAIADHAGEIRNRVVHATATEASKRIDRTVTTASVFVSSRLSIGGKVEIRFAVVEI
ncbi:hypothetical protein PMKS-000530 [Pichia membranifaciens]|uniref:Uncharacterized protein n=1 Tax=Pichia membranifaciens TaxID=4926 RepID=A0A1Q2YC18_9ASCO|nr:hypothetical protein PMKS-000530 [Pichia membranifaciens]